MDSMFDCIYYCSADVCKPRCQQVGCGTPITTIVAMVSCSGCTRDYHKQCVGLEDRVTGFSIPACPMCDNDIYIMAGLNLTLSNTLDNALAKSTQQQYKSKLRQIERVLTRILGVTFPQFFIRQGLVDTSLVHKYLLVRKQEGASRNVIQTEMTLWQEILTDIGQGQLPHQWLEYKIKRYFPLREKKVERVKAPLVVQQMSAMLKGLKQVYLDTASSQIAVTLALRDTLLLCCGFFLLLRRSEIVGVQLNHFQGTGDGFRLLIPKSKTDQCARGVTIPVPANLPMIGKIEEVVDKVRTQWQRMGWAHNSIIAVSYKAHSKAVADTALSKDAITARLRLLLQRYTGLTPEQVKEFASHSLRRGGATFYHSRGIAPADLQELGRWRSDAFKLYTEPVLQRLNNRISYVAQNNKLKR